MKISTKGKYGLEALADLAIYGANDYINLKSISERQGISYKYLEQLFMLLKKDGIVESIRGAQGGYKLARNAKEISVNDILNSLEGPLALVDCILEIREKRCDQFECCITRVLWQKIMKELDEVTEAISLDDIATLFKASRKGDNEYFI